MRVIPQKLIDSCGCNCPYFITKHNAICNFRELYCCLHHRTIGSDNKGFPTFCKLPEVVDAVQDTNN